MSAHHGTWQVHTVDGADVRLRSGRIGLMSVDVSAPVTDGFLHVTEDSVRLTLTLALDRLRAGNFLMEGAARSLVKRHDATALGYDGLGPSSTAPWQVTGTAGAGTIALDLSLTITPVGADDLMDEIELVGSAYVGTVHLPLPGLGKVDDFAFDVDARLALLAP
ncbi:MAG: hypothetical protein Q8M17_08335 [Actinomycetota bacterium]|nr:hypothetical protein [Actinomycetota bacterium]